MRKTTDNNRLWNSGIILFVMICLLCAPSAHAQSPEEIIAQELDTLNINVTHVEIAPEWVRVKYKQPPVDIDNAIIINTATIMEVTAKTLPSVPRIIVDIEYLDEPLVEISGATSNVQDMLTGQMGWDAFVAALTFSENRDPATALLQNMALLGIMDPELDVQDTELHVTFTQPVAEPAEALIAGWVQVLQWVADKTAGLSRTTLHCTFADGSKVDVSANMPDVLAFRSGEMSLAELLVTLEITGLPEVTLAELSPAAPTPFLMLPTPTAAGVITAPAAPQPTGQELLPMQPPATMTIPTLSPLQAVPPVIVRPTLPSPAQAEPVATPTQPQLATPMPSPQPVQQSPPPAPQEAVPGRIVFASNFQGDYEIYVINPDGSNLVRLTDRPGEDWFPVWSPDGNTIAYQYMCAEHGVFHLCFMNTDGSNVRCLKPTVQDKPASVQRPDWSPDGRSFVCSLESTSQPTTINILSGDGSMMTTLSTGRDPSWSRADSRITFMENGQVFVINADGSGKQQLTNNPGICMYPTWSPDGTRIAYSVDGQGLHIMNADGSGDQIVAPNTSWGLAWSPDGTQLALGSDNTLMVLGGDGSLARNLMQGVQPSWSRGGGATAAPLTEPAPAQAQPAAAQGQPAFGPLQFCAYIDNQGNPHDTRSDFPYGTLEINPYWTYSGMQPGTPYHTVWQIHSEDLSIPGDGVFGDPAGLESRALTRDQGAAPLLVGSYTFVVEFGGQVVLSSDFTVSASAPPLQPRPAGAETAPVAAASGLSGYIAYPVFKPGMAKPTYDVYVSKADGSERRLLWEWGRQPDIRRGDGRVVLNGDGLGKDNLWTVNLDGSDAKESSPHPEDSHPRWSPNGDRLLFDSEFYPWNDQRQWTVWVQNSADKGSEPVSVEVAGRVVPGQNPIWLDNDWVVYTGCNFWEGGGRCGLYTCPSWGDAGARMLTDQPDDRAGDFFGERIAYMSLSSGNWDVWTVNFDGSGKVNLTNAPSNEGLPAFSPDGSKIAFLSDRGGVWAIWVMNIDGSSPQKLFDIGGTMGDDWATERISWGP